MKKLDMAIGQNVYFKDSQGTPVKQEVMERIPNRIEVKTLGKSQAAFSKGTRATEES